MKINAIFYYGFVTGLFYGIFAGLVFYISFTRDIDKIVAQVKSPKPQSIQSPKISSLSKNIAKLSLIIIAIVYLYTILEIYNNQGNVKHIFDIPGEYFFLWSVSMASLFISAVFFYYQTN